MNLLEMVKMYFQPNAKLNDCVVVAEGGPPAPTASPQPHHGVAETASGARIAVEPDVCLHPSPLQQHLSGFTRCGQCGHQSEVRGSVGISRAEFESGDYRNPHLDPPDFAIARGRLCGKPKC